MIAPGWRKAQSPEIEGWTYIDPWYVRTINTVRYWWYLLRRRDGKVSDAS